MAITSTVDPESGSGTLEHFSAVLFDLDGTLIDSTEAVVRHWTAIAKELDMDPQKILATSHGRRSIDVLKIIAPDRANMEYVMHVESLIPKLYADGAKELPGTRDIVTALTKANANWAIVTSGTMALASNWLKVMDLPEPSIFITAEQVKNGKPDPEGYLMAKERFLKEGKVAEGSKILVVEDAPAGIKAGKAAGCHVLGLTTTHTREEALEAGADWVVDDLSKVEFVKADNDGGFELRIACDDTSL